MTRTEYDTELLKDRTFYLSGPMSGIPAYNYPFFERVASKLRQLGLKIVSPHEIPVPPDDVIGNDAYEWYMQRCFEQIATCTDIILLWGWPESPGANRELAECVRRMFPVWYFDTNDEVTDYQLIWMSRIGAQGELDAEIEPEAEAPDGA